MKRRFITMECRKKIGSDGFIAVTGWHICVTPKKSITFPTLANALFAIAALRVNVICFIHNAGDFAFHQFRDHIPDFSQIKIIKDKIAAFKIDNCEFRDASLILPIKIAKINPQNKPESRILFELIRDFEASAGRHLTISGAGRTDWRRLAKRRMPKSTRIYYQIFRNFYHGGRTETYRTGNLGSGWKIYDINSAYPSAMQYYHPIGTHPIKVYDRAEIIATLRNKKAMPMFLKINCAATGAFPIAIWKGKRKSLYFPKDNRLMDFHITSHELIAALAIGIYQLDEIIIHHAIIFDEYTTFQSYVKKWADIKETARAAGETGTEITAKLMLNSLYGGFAINPDNFMDYIVAPVDEQEGLSAEGWTAKFGGWGDLRCIYERKPETINRHINVATSASITGQVRSDMLRAINIADSVVYCDTDSIFCKSAGTLPIGKKIGEWKHEGTLNELIIAAPKMYMAHFDTGKIKVVSKGVNLTAAELRRVADGEIVITELDKQTQGITGEPYKITRTIGKKTAKKGEKRT